MRKASKLIILLLLTSCFLAGQEIVYEQYPEGVDFWVMIPYNTINFKRNTESAQLSVAVEIRNLDTRKTTSLEQTLHIPKRDWLSDTAVLASFQRELDAGRYQSLLRIRNVDLGDYLDLKKTFEIGDAYTEIGQPYFIVTREGVEFLPSNAEKVPIPVEKCEIRQKFTISPDSLLINLGEQIFVFTEPVKQIAADLTDLINVAGISKPVMSIYEDNIRYDMDVFLYDQWFSYNVRYTPEDQIKQLRYIASQNEWKSIKAMPEDRYPEVIDRFWKVHDPSPGTIRNEARETFNLRVIIADKRYTIHKKMKGWSSDRGRIYIKYGEPDEIHSEVHPIDLYPYIIWVYYTGNLEFQFEDRNGFGQYKLRNKDEEY